jgi:hypothetical protein
VPPGVHAACQVWHDAQLISSLRRSTGFPATSHSSHLCGQELLTDYHVTTLRPGAARKFLQAASAKDTT